MNKNKPHIRGPSLKEVAIALLPQGALSIPKNVDDQVRRILPDLAKQVRDSGIPLESTHTMWGDIVHLLRKEHIDQIKDMTRRKVNINSEKPTK